MVGDGPLILPRALQEQVVAHARAGLPNEACGILAGRNGHAEHFFPAVNGEPSPFFYNIDAADLHRILFQESAALYPDDDPEDCIAAIYHSPVSSPAFPSRSDVDIAMWPDPAYLIVSFGSEPPELKAFGIRDGKITRRELRSDL